MRNRKRSDVNVIAFPKRLRLDECFDSPQSGVEIYPCTLLFLHIRGPWFQVQIQRLLDPKNVCLLINLVLVCSFGRLHVKVQYDIREDGARFMPCETAFQSHVSVVVL